MNINNQTIDILVRQFFHSYFTKAGGSMTCDISSAEPVAIKQMLVNNIDSMAKDFNAAMARAFAFMNGIEIPERMASPNNFDEETALIRYTLNGSDELFSHMAERYRHHFELALSGTVEKACILTDTDIKKAAELLEQMI